MVVVGGECSNGFYNRKHITDQVSMSYNGTKEKYRYFAKNIEISITYELLGRFPSSFDGINCNDRMYAYTYRNRYISRYILHLDLKLNLNFM